MAKEERLDIPDLITHLRRTFRHGARAAQLVAYVPGLVDLLYPANDAGSLTIYDRAVMTEEAITEAVRAMDAPRNTAMEIMMCLRPGTLDVRVEKRRVAAARLFAVSAETFRRRERHEPMLLLDLALTLYRRRGIC